MPKDRWTARLRSVKLSCIGRWAGGMPFYIVHISGRAAGKRARVDPEGFETYQLAESTARARWPEQAYFVIEADEETAAARRAIRESGCLDDWAP